MRFVGSVILFLSAGSGIVNDRADCFLIPVRMRIRKS
ncbi:MAG: hypothetical protein ACLTJG_22065 [[Clostridium] innocuum]